MPKIFNVNWFRRDAAGNFVWPGFGQNTRVLEWMINRCEETIHAEETPIGFVPGYEDLNWTGTTFSREEFEQVTSQDHDLWVAELESHKDLFAKIGDALPEVLRERNAQLMASLQAKKALTA